MPGLWISFPDKENTELMRKTWLHTEDKQRGYYWNRVNKDTTSHTTPCKNKTRIKVKPTPGLPQLSFCWWSLSFCRWRSLRYAVQPWSLSTLVKTTRGICCTMLQSPFAVWLSWWSTLRDMTGSVDRKLWHDNDMYWGQLVHPPHNHIDTGCVVYPL